MKACRSCTCELGECNWLDGELACPHCGGDLTWFRGAPMGDVMDELSMLAPPDTSPR